MQVISFLTDSCSNTPPPTNTYNLKHSNQIGFCQNLIEFVQTQSRILLRLIVLYCKIEATKEKQHAVLYVGLVRHVHKML